MAAATAIFQPMMAMVGVTGAVWSLLYIRRIAFLKRHDIDPQDISIPTDKTEVFKTHDGGAYAQLPANNLANLFEMPVLFYVLCIAAYQLNMASGMLFMLAWTYVGLRAVHSVIHCTYNKVMHRFTAYFLSCLVLWVMAVMIALKAFSG